MRELTNAECRDWRPSDQYGYPTQLMSLLDFALSSIHVKDSGVIVIESNYKKFCISRLWHPKLSKAQVDHNYGHPELLSQYIDVCFTHTWYKWLKKGFSPETTSPVSKNGSPENQYGHRCRATYCELPFWKSNRGYNVTPFEFWRGHAVFIYWLWCQTDGRRMEDGTWWPKIPAIPIGHQLGLLTAWLCPSSSKLSLG